MRNTGKNYTWKGDYQEQWYVPINVINIPRQNQMDLVQKVNLTPRQKEIIKTNPNWTCEIDKTWATELEKIKEDHPRGKPKGSKTVAPLYIANPFKSMSVSSIWSTHPPIDERIRRLRSM